jgi:hypothetical protein
MPNQSSFFLVYVLLPGPPGESEGPWGNVLVEIPFRAGQQSIRVQAGMVAHETGSRKWSGLIRPLTELVPQPCTCDLAPLPEADIQHQLGNAWVVTPELRPHIHLVSPQ